MAGSKADPLENAILDHILGGPNYTREATVWIALFTVAPTDSTPGTEVSGGSYARVAVTNDSTNWPAAAAGSKANGVQFSFPQATASWGTVNSFAIMNHASGNLNSNYLYWGDLSIAKGIDNGDTASFAVGAITITED